MEGLQYYCIDTETNGLNSKIHEINEISIIRCKDKIQLTLNIKCETPQASNFDALKMTNKTLEDILQGMSKEEAIEIVDKFLNEDGLTPAHRVFIAHNWSFDKKFIHALYTKVNKECPVNMWLCTMEMTKKYIKSIGIKSKVNLADACNVVGIKKYAGAHASKVDTRNTYLLWKDLVENKNIDYLPLIKTCNHSVSNEEIDLSILDE